MSSAPVKPIGDISSYDIWVLRLTYSFMMEKGMATHSCSCLENSMGQGAWGLQSMGSQRVRHDWVTKTHKFKYVDYVLLNYNIYIHHICIHTYIYLAALASLVVVHGLNYPSTCGILVPWPGIEPRSLALEGGFFTTGPPRKFHTNIMYFNMYEMEYV